MTDFKGKTAFITGGASGLGLGIAKACAQAGMNVVIADLRQNVIDTALPEFEKNNWPVLGIQLDVSKFEQYEKAIALTEEKFGNIHLLVNNAGISCAYGSIHEVTFKDIEIGYNVNLWGVINGIRLVLPHMLAHGEESYIVSTGSMSGLFPTAKFDIYNSSKAAVIALTESLAPVLADTNVGISVFCPGPHNTTLGSSSGEVAAVLAGEEYEKPAEAASAPDFDETLTRTTAEAGKRVLRGIERKDLYILTHCEFKPALQERFDAILRALPDETPHPKFNDEFSFIVENPAFKNQKVNPALNK